MEQLVNNNEITECQTNLNTDVNNNDVANSQQTNRFVSLPIQFLLECIFLAILDSKGMQKFSFSIQLDRILIKYMI